MLVVCIFHSYAVSMYTIVGLGNPGGEYANTRHNAGRIIVETVAREHSIALSEKKKPPHRVHTGEISGERVRLVLPDTFMNKSGSAVAAYIKSVSAAKRLVVVYDDIDLPLGKVRVSFGSSSGGHNGVKSIERAVRTKNFIKIRIGVSKAASGKARKPVGDEAVVGYLLAKFTKGELEKLRGPITARVSLALETIVGTRDPIMGMNAVNGLPAL